MTEAQGERLRLPEVVHLKWDELLEIYNQIVGRLNRIAPQYPVTFPSTSGKNVEGVELASRMESITYKLYWACKSLEYLMEYHESHTKSLDDSMHSMTEKVPDAFFFNVDVFFSSCYGALDITAGIISMLVETGIDEDHVYFTNVLEYLIKSGVDSGSVLTDLKRESDSGWLYEFRQHRIFVTHHGLVRPRSQFSYTSSGHTAEVNLYMLPDNPKKRPLTYNRKRELAPYCLEIVVKEFETITTLLRLIEKMIPDI